MWLTDNVQGVRLEDEPGRGSIAADVMEKQLYGNRKWRTDALRGAPETGKDFARLIWYILLQNVYKIFSQSIL